ncbi:hypothetical protein IAD21_05361 [Abditibacteriota bacterium]|nr:hypothetical protein IAD21_05361 [Abditibacteriota bacterium]
MNFWWLVPEDYFQWRSKVFNYRERDEFLSEEDLDLANLDWPELIATWNAWLLRMQITNEEDEDDYSHGVFLSEKQKRRLWGDDWEKKQ